MTDYSLLVAFDRDTDDFAHGVECGRVWERMKTSEPLDEIVHVANGEMFLRMAESVGRRVCWEQIDDTWARLVDA